MKIRVWVVDGTLRYSPLVLDSWHAPCVARASGAVCGGLASSCAVASDVCVSERLLRYCEATARHLHGSEVKVKKTLVSQDGSRIDSIEDGKRGPGWKRPAREITCGSEGRGRLEEMRDRRPHRALHSQRLIVVLRTPAPPPPLFSLLHPPSPPPMSTTPVCTPTPHT